MALEKIISVEELNKKTKTIFKKDNKQIAVFNLNNQIFAIDNRCPHEGYPLIQGTNNESCVLTCNWHNWKFDLKNGQCLTGGDNVKTYKTVINDNFVYIDLSEPTKSEIETQILDGLYQAFQDRQYGRISRELARLYYNKIDPLIAFKKAVLWSYDKLEDGTTHAYAAGADWLKLYLDAESLENKIIFLTEAIDYISFDSLRHKVYPYSQKEKEWSYNEFIQAVENEDEALASELINGAYAQGMHFNDLEKALVNISLMHYNDFGHSLIYVQKTAYLIEKLGSDIEKELTLALVRSVIKATREDLIPDFKHYQNYLNSKTESELVEENNLFLQNTNNSMKITLSLLEHKNFKEVYELLLEANAKNLLYFDTKYQENYNNKVSENIGWLDFSHALTFANAVNQLCTKYPEFWKEGLLQMACFNGRNIDYLDLDLKTEIYNIENYDNFKAETIEKLTDHAIPSPIFPAHILKTSISVFDEYEKTNNANLGKYLLSSLNRFISSPIKQKNIKRTIKQSLELVSRDFKGE